MYNDKVALLISSYFPYPLDDGGKVDIFNRIKAIKSLGFKIYLICFVKDIPKEEHIKILSESCKVFVLNRNYNIFSIFSFLPFQVKSRIPSKIEIYKLFNKIKDVFFDMVIVEHLYSVGFWNAISQNIKYGMSFIRIHNDEKSYFWNLFLAEKNIIKKIFYFFESCKFYFFEKKVFSKKFDVYLHISYDEKIKYQKKYPSVNNVFFPTHITDTYIKKYEYKSEKNILFIGALFMQVNMEAIAWYIKNVHFNIFNKYNDYKLIVAGNTRNNKIIKTKFKGNGIMFFDSPTDEELQKIYRISKVFIAPLLHGAGVKIKVINAICNALPIVSTSKGIEGTGLQHKKHILLANNPEEFQRNIIALFKNKFLCERLVIESQKYIIENYNEAKILKSLLSKIV